MIIDLTNEKISDQVYMKYHQIIHDVKEIMLRKAIPGGKIAISIRTSKDIYECIYFHRHKDEIIKLIEENQDIDLRNSYISGLNFNRWFKKENREILNIYASHSFIEGGLRIKNITIKGSEINFEYAYFSRRNINFIDSDLRHTTINFKGAVGNAGQIGFHYCRFKEGNRYFNFAKFDRCKILFRGTTFEEGLTTFYGAIFDEAIFLNCAFLSHISLEFKTIETLLLFNCTIMQSVILEKTYPKKISFLETKNFGQIFASEFKCILNAMYNNGWEKEYIINKRIKENRLDWNMSSQMRMLKENFKKIGFYEQEDEAYRAYMKYKALETNGGIISYVIRFFYGVFGLISGYGTRPFRLLLTSLVVVILCGFVFALNMDASSLFRQFFKGQYFSTITFLTIGYGDIHPPNALCAILAGLEGFIGLFLMSFFTVSVARKILR